MADEAPRIRPAYVTLDGQFFAYKDGEERLFPVQLAEQTRSFDAANFTTLIGADPIFGPNFRYLESWAILGNRAFYQLVLEGMTIEDPTSGLLQILLPFELRDPTRATCVTQDDGVGGGGSQNATFVGVNPDEPSPGSNLVVVTDPVIFGVGIQTLSAYLSLTLVIVP